VPKGFFVTSKNDCMKLLYFLLLTYFLFFAGCSKSNSVTAKSHDGTNYWKLLQRVWSIGPYTNSEKPDSDSAVELVLAADSTYMSNLNGQLICTGKYSITNGYVLELNSFKTTGIFSLFVGYLVDSAGNVLSMYDAFTMNVSNDTLTLTSAITPGGYEFYTFIKE
jgi:hypothetical protein